MGEDNLYDLREPRNSVLHYILNNSCNKIPLKQSEIVARALNGNSSLFGQVLDGVKGALENTYGMLLLAVPEAKTGKQFICVSKFPAVSSLEYDESQRSQITLLFLVLSYIYMKGISIAEGRGVDVIAAWVIQEKSKLLSEQLNIGRITTSAITFPVQTIEAPLLGLQIYFDRPHPFFGPNIKKLITETFVKQLYLKKTKSDSDAIENTHFYSWGYRSEVEFPQKEVLDAVSKLLNKPAKHFVLQYTQAHSDETSDQR